MALTDRRYEPSLPQGDRNACNFQLEHRRKLLLLHFGPGCRPHSLVSRAPVFHRKPPPHQSWISSERIIEFKHDLMS